MIYHNMTSPSQDKPQDPVGFQPHDHGRCFAALMAAAERRCSELGLRFTPVRRKALEILLHEHRAMGAYDVLEQLRREGFGSQPPVAYRALDFLVDNGFAHRIERLNAFVACAHPDHDHAPAFMICRSCDTVAEAQTQRSDGALAGMAQAAGFQIERTVVEAEGLCPKCQDTPS